MGSASVRADATSDQTEAKARFRAGAAYFDGKLYDKAIVEFEASFKLAPLPETLFTLAQCHRLRGDNNSAVEYYKRYLNLKPNGRGAPEAREFIAGLEEQLSAQRDVEVQRQLAIDAQRKDSEAQRKSAQAQTPTALEVAAPLPPPKQTPLVKKWWLWTIVGVAVVGVGVGLGVGLGLSRPASAPTVESTDGTFRWSDAR